jgi:hypothetical protein
MRVLCIESKIAFGVERYRYKNSVEEALEYANSITVYKGEWYDGIENNTGDIMVYDIILPSGYTLWFDSKLFITKQQWYRDKQLEELGI